MIYLTNICNNNICTIKRRQALTYVTHTRKRDSITKVTYITEECIIHVRGGIQFDARSKSLIVKFSPYRIIITLGFFFS
jgi:hypothetical protein